jgi:hypothetical protein
VILGLILQTQNRIANLEKALSKALLKNNKSFMLYKTAKINLEESQVNVNFRMTNFKELLKKTKISIKRLQ